MNRECEAHIARIEYLTRIAESKEEGILRGQVLPGGGASLPQALGLICEGVRGACSKGVWEVICRWGTTPGTKVIRNVLVENVETGERIVRPWYPAPKVVERA